MTLTRRLREAARARAPDPTSDLPCRLRDANEIIDLRDPSPGPRWPDTDQARRLRLTLGRIEDPGDMRELQRRHRGRFLRRFLPKS